MVRVYCTRHDPIYLILAEKFCFTIIKIEIYQQNYFTKGKLINKLGNFEWFKKRIYKCKITCDFARLVFYAWFNVRGTVITERHTALKNHLIQEHYSVHTERTNQARPKCKQYHRCKICIRHSSNQNDLFLMATFTLELHDFHVSEKYGFMLEDPVVNLVKNNPTCW